MKFLFVPTLTSFAFGHPALAQNLSKKDVETAVLKTAELIEENYVFGEKGKEISADLINQFRNGKICAVKSWKDFAISATKILQNFSRDGHLYVRYNPEQVKELLGVQNNASSEPPEEDGFFYGAKAAEKNYGFREVKILDDNIGYIKLSELNISEKSLPLLLAAMRFVSGTKALIIDLRDNGGGGSEIGAVFESFFLPKNVALLEFRSRRGTVEVSKTVPWLTETKYDQPVYILINKKTGSAAEAFAYSLQAKKRAKVVGQPSAGAANMNSWYAINDYIYVSVSTSAPTLPGSEESWEQRGVQPDYNAAPGKEIEFVRKVVNKQP
jgi:hypothetical protein